MSMVKKSRLAAHRQMQNGVLERIEVLAGLQQKGMLTTSEFQVLKDALYLATDLSYMEFIHDGGRKR